MAEESEEFSALLEPEFEPFMEVQAEREDELLDMANVVGVGVGNKIKDGVVTDAKAVMVLVNQKVDPDLLDRKDKVPKSLKNRPTDVMEVGDLIAGGGDAERTTRVAPLAAGVASLTQRARPAMGGYSVGHPRVTAGTAGTGCYDASALPGMPSRYYILSNNHVLANSNAARIGDPILQPGRIDGGTIPNDVIGRLARFVPIRFGTGLNLVDAALAEVPFPAFSREIYYVGYTTAPRAPAAVGRLVKKTGRTTNFTTGRIRVVNATANVNYGGGRIARFHRQIMTTAMSAGGDSGSLVLNPANEPVGLLFAGSHASTIINPISFVESALGIRLWP